MGWDHWLTIEAEGPVFLRIARAVSEDVRRGRLRPGDPLPGSRTLAESLGVHRNTVLAAYRELAAEGWIDTRPAGGTFVRGELPEIAPRRFAPRRESVPSRAGYELPPALEGAFVPEHPKGTLVLAGGVPDLRLAPTTALARAYRRALSKPTDVLAYGHAQGHPKLRAALAPMLARLRGLAASPDEILITRGSQMALDLAARMLIRPGDVVAVEALGYRPAWGAFAAAGAKIAPIPVDREGIRVDLIPPDVRAIYVTPHHQYPTMVTLSAARRLALLELARTQRIAVIEDDYDYEFHYDGRPVLPLASADRAGVVLYIGTLSKILAPGLRLGFLVATPDAIARLTALRTLADRQGDPAIEAAVGELLEDDEVQRHARRVRRIYRDRRDVLCEAIDKQLAGVFEVTPPAGGMAVWAKVAPEIDVDTLAERAMNRGVAFMTARRFAFDGRARPFARLGFAALDPRELREAIGRIHSVLPRKTKGSRRGP
ncbi:MAG: MocR-like pyridoxine biosynthesis transcription factor PdxR [Polyangiales bacterium]